MPFRNLLPTAAVVAFVGVGLALVPPPVGKPDVVKFVSSMPRSGSARAQTDTIVNGIKLALSEVEYRVEAGGKTYAIEYEDLDDATAAAGQWTGEQETANATQARLDPDAMVYIGTYNSGAAKISMPILNEASMLMVSPANTAPELTQPREGERDEPMRYRPSGHVNYVRVVPTDNLQGPAAAEWSRTLGARRVYVLDENDLYGKGIATRYVSHARKIGLEVLGHESIDPKSQGFVPLMTKIARGKPDLIFYGGTGQGKAGQLVKDMVSAGMGQTKMMGPDGCYEPALLSSAGAAADGRFYATFAGLPVDELGKSARGSAFLKGYEAKYGRRPTESYAAYGYDCGRVAVEAVRRAGCKDRDAIRAAGIGIADFDGTAGRWSFDANGDTTLRAMSGFVVEAGDWKFVRRLDVTRK